MEYVIEELAIRMVEKTEHDRKMFEGFFAQMGEESANYFNIGRGNEMRVYDWFDGGNEDHMFWIAIGYDEAGNEEIAGYVFIWDKQSRIPWLGIAVAEKWKGRRLGGRLIEAVRVYFAENGYGGIFLTTAEDNVRGQKLYERCGFEKLGKAPDGQFLYCLRIPK